MALVNGVDPGQYLDADMSEVIVMNQVITKAQELRAERKRKEIESLGIVIANNLGKMFR